MFSRRFPRDVKGSTYPVWEDVYLADEEVARIEDAQHKENVSLMKECINDAKILFKEEGLKDYQTDIVNAAIALFEKRASHSVYWKEEAAKQKFDSTHRQ